MQILNHVIDKFMAIGRLAVKDPTDEDAKVYVVWEMDEEEHQVHLVELDRPQDGENQWVDLDGETVYLLEPLEVVERVMEWK